MSRMKEVKAALLGEVRALVGELAPGGRFAGRVYTSRNPGRGDRKAGSFVVWLDGPAAGGWKDYATGESGDIIDLIALSYDCDRKDALKWAETRLGWSTMSDAARRAYRRQARAKAAKMDADLEHRRARNLDRVRRIWTGAETEIGNSLAAVYLASRGIDLAAVKNREPSFRFLPAFENWQDAEYGEDGKKIRPGRKFPVMLSAMVNRAGHLRALHFTYLAADGRGKAPVDKPKLMWPSTAGLVIRVTRGAGNRKCETAAEAGRPAPVALVEGIEDALSIGLAAPELRIWAAGSLPGLLTVPDHDAASAWLVLRDNDWDKPQAVELFDRAMARLRKTGKPVEVVQSSHGKDANDLLRSG